MGLRQPLPFFSDALGRWRKDEGRWASRSEIGVRALTR